MAGVAMEWDDSGFQTMLADMIRRNKDMGPVMRDFSQHMVHETTMHFEDEKDPSGQGWQKLSDVTLKLREEAGKTGNILQVDGRLKTSIDGTWDGYSATVAASNLEYAAIHNFGGMAGRNRKVKIPQRQFLGFNDDDLKYAMESIKGWMIAGKVG